MASSCMKRKLSDDAVDSATSIRRKTTTTMASMVAKTDNSIEEKKRKGRLEFIKPKLKKVPTRLYDPDLMCENSDTVRHAVANMCVLFTGKKAKKNRYEAMNLGAAGIIIHIMNKWIGNVETQVHCCNMMSTLINYNDDHNSDAAVIFASVGGMEAIVNALKAYPDTFYVQNNGILALSNMLKDKDDSTVADAAKRFVLDLGGAELIVDAMKQFNHTILCQLTGCNALDVLSNYDDLKTHLTESGALGVLAAASENNPDDMEIQEPSFNALHKLTHPEGRPSPNVVEG